MIRKAAPRRSALSSRRAPMHKTAPAAEKAATTAHTRGTGNGDIANATVAEGTATSALAAATIARICTDPANRAGSLSLAPATPLDVRCPWSRRSWRSTGRSPAGNARSAASQSTAVPSAAALASSSSGRRTTVSGHLRREAQESPRHGHSSRVRAWLAERKRQLLVAVPSRNRPTIAARSAERSRANPLANACSVSASDAVSNGEGL